MTKKLIWRLSSLPSVVELRELVKDKIITQEEARGILFSSENQEDRDKKSLESEIKFLRELVETLSQNKGQIVKVIREIETPWRDYPWYKPYVTWYNDDGGFTATTATTNITGAGSYDYTAASNFSNIKTF